MSLQQVVYPTVSHVFTPADGVSYCKPCLYTSRWCILLQAMSLFQQVVYPTVSFLQHVMWCILLCRVPYSSKPCLYSSSGVVYPTVVKPCPFSITLCGISYCKPFLYSSRWCDVSYCKPCPFSSR